MRKTMKLFIAIILLSSVIVFFVLNGCGKGGASGGCVDNAAPTGATITGPSSLTAPFTSTTSCYNSLIFSVKDSGGKPMNGVCVEIFSDVDIAIHDGSTQCSNVPSPQNSLVARTDGYGNVLVDLLSGPTPTGKTHWVQVTSGAASALAQSAGAE